MKFAEEVIEMLGAFDLTVRDTLLDPRTLPITTEPAP